ncbi:MAG: hypothetical protein ABW007_19010 [Chitinophagaceae bacterium]
MSTVSPSLPLRKLMVAIAKSMEGVRENPKNSNRGDQVEQFQRATDLPGTGWPYCAAFVCWVVQQWGYKHEKEVLAALKLKDRAAFDKWRPKTAAAYGFDEWGISKGLKVWNEQKQPGLVLHTGDIFSLNTASHCGMIYDDKGEIVYTIEGNTDESGSREGGGVYLKTRKRSHLRDLVRLLD